MRLAIVRYRGTEHGQGIAMVGLSSERARGPYFLVKPVLSAALVARNATIELWTGLMNDLV